MIRIFANLGTKRRVAKWIPDRKDIHSTMVNLNKMSDGKADWVYVQDLKENELIGFESWEEYNGCDFRNDNDYCRGSIFKIQ